MYRKNQVWDMKIQNSFVHSSKLASALIRSKIMAATDKAIMVKCYARVEPSDHCHRCGKEIKNEVSMIVGYGPECSDHLGIPRDVSEEMIGMYREKAKKATLIEQWIPINCIESSEMIKDAPKSQDDVTEIYIDGRFIYVRAPYHLGRGLAQIKPNTWMGNEKVRKYPVSAAVASNIMKFFESENVEIDKIDDEFKAVLEQAEMIKEAKHRKTQEDFSEVPCTKFQPWQHQSRAFWFVADIYGGLPE